MWTQKQLAQLNHRGLEYRNLPLLAGVPLALEILANPEEGLPYLGSPFSRTIKPRGEEDELAVRNYALFLKRLRGFYDRGVFGTEQSPNMTILFQNHGPVTHDCLTLGFLSMDTRFPPLTFSLDLTISSIDASNQVGYKASFYEPLPEIHAGLRKEFLGY